MADIISIRPKREYTPTEMGDELSKAATAWGMMMQEALDAKFGKDRAGFALVICSARSGGSMHLKTNLKHEGLVPLFRELADKISQGMKGTIIF